MALNLGNLFFTIGAKTKGVEDGVKKTKKEISGLEKGINRLAGAITIAFAYQQARRILLMAENAKLLDARIRNVSRSTAEFNRNQAALLKIANDNGVAFAEVVNQFQAMKIAARELGRSNEDVIELTDAVNQLGIIGGATADAMKFSMRQFGQAMAGGVVRAEEFNSIIENTPLLALAIADGLGVSVGQLRKMVIAGEVLSEDVFKALLGQTDAIQKRFEKMPLTTTRAIQGFTNNMQQAFKDLDAEIETSEGLANFIQDASEEIRPLMNNFLKGVHTLQGAWQLLFINVEAGWKFINLNVGQFIAAIEVGFKGIGPLFQTAMQVALIKIKGSVNELIETLNLVPGVNIPLMDVEVNKQAIREIAKETQDMIKKAGLLTKKEQEVAHNAIVTERDDRKKAAAAEFVEDIRRINDRARARVEAEKKATEEIKKKKVLPEDAFISGPVSGVDKILADMGDETQGILNKLRERNQAILDATKEGEDQRLQLLRDSNAIALEEMGIHAVNRIAQIEESERKRREFILEHTKLTGEARAQLEQQLIQESANKVIVAQAQTFANVAASMATVLGDLQGALQQAGVKSKALMTGLFLAQKAIQVAMIIANTFTASTGMMAAIPGPAGIAMAQVVQGIGFAAAGLVAGLSVGQAATGNLGGGRQSGGSLMQGMTHQVNEDGAPEVFEQGNKRFLLSSRSGGRIIGGGDLARGAANSAMAAPQPVINVNAGVPSINIVNETGIPIEKSSVGVTADEVTIMLRQSERRTENKINTSLATGRGATAKGLKQGFSVSRSIK